MTNNYPAVFVRANISFTLMGTAYTFANQNISLFGVSGLRWPYFDPADITGQEVQVTVDVLVHTRYRFMTSGYIMSEETGTAHYVGIQFKLDEEQKAKLQEAVNAEGFYPTQHIRKYPRIPANELNPTMPLRAIVKNESNELIAFDIANLSPNGILLTTENPRASLIIARQRIHVQVEPRGDIFLPFSFEGLVCRIYCMRNAKNGNIVRSFGTRFVKFAHSDKQNFLEVLRSVLDNIRKKS